MSKLVACIALQDGKLDEIMKRLQAAQQEIYDCYRELDTLGVLRIEKESADSGN